MPAPRKAWLPSAGCYMGLGFPVTEQLWLEIDGSVGAKWVFMAEDRVDVILAARIGAGIGWRFW